jgi:hypothetical protein
MRCLGRWALEVSQRKILSQRKKRKITPRFAPSDEHARALKKAQTDRPNHALTALAMLRAVRDGRFALLAHRASHFTDVGRLARSLERLRVFAPSA